MLNLVSRAPHSIISVVGETNYRVHCGLLTGTFSGFDPRTALEHGATWAADNGCFQPGYNADRILGMLKRYSCIEGCKWVVAPDVVQDAGATMLMLGAWLPTFRWYGFPVALAIQNGIENYRIPWDSIACIFIGGNDEFKYSDTVRNIVADAKRRGKWVHNGRVNTPERILYSRVIGCDSFDGTHFTRVTKDVAKYLPLQTASIEVAMTAQQAYKKEVVASTGQLKLAI